jgi:hypothetical protein
VEWSSSFVKVNIKIREVIRGMSDAEDQGMQLEKATPPQSNPPPSRSEAWLGGDASGREMCVKISLIHNANQPVWSLFGR